MNKRKNFIFKETFYIWLWNGAFSYFSQGAPKCSVTPLSSEKFFHQHVQRELKYQRHTITSISQTFFNVKRSCSVVAKWPLLINANMFDKADLNISREVRGTPLIP